MCTYIMMSGMGLSVVEPGLVTSCNYWSYSEVRGTVVDHDLLFISRLL